MRTERIRGAYGGVVRNQPNGAHRDAVVLVYAPLVWTLLAVALVLAQTWFFHYGTLVGLSDRNWLVLTRDLLLVGVFVLLLRAAAKDQDPVPLEDELPLRAPA